MQTVAAASLGVFSPNTGPAVKTGNDQGQVQNGDSPFTQLLTQGKQKENELTSSDASQDTCPKKEEQTLLNMPDMSSLILQLLAPANLQGAIPETKDSAGTVAISSVDLSAPAATMQGTETAVNLPAGAIVSSNTPANEMPVQGGSPPVVTSAAEAPASFMAAMQNGPQLTDVVAKVSPEPGKEGAADTQTKGGINGAETQSEYLPSQSDSALGTQNSPQQIVTPLQQSEVPVQQGEMAPAVSASSSGTMNEKKVQGTGTAEQANPVVDVAKTVMEKLHSMSGENPGDAGTGDSPEASSQLEEKGTQNADLNSKGEVSAEFLIGGNSSQTVEKSEMSQAVQKALNRFVDDLREAKTNGPEIKIVLEPESLGTLTISVSHTASGVMAKIRSEDQNICALISNELPKLISSMEQKGITVDQVDVFLGGSQQNFNFSQNNFGGRDQKPQTYAVRPVERAENSAGSYLPDTWQEVAAGEVTDGSVEYRV